MSVVFTRPLSLNEMLNCTYEFQEKTRQNFSELYDEGRFEEADQIAKIYTERRELTAFDLSEYGDYDIFLVLKRQGDWLRVASRDELSRSLLKGINILKTPNY